MGHVMREHISCPRIQEHNLQPSNQVSPALWLLPVEDIHTAPLGVVLMVEDPSVTAESKI